VLIYQATHYRSMVRTNIEAMLDEPVLPFLSQIKQDTLVIFGKQDGFIPR
jgi:hypothetical protein